MFLKEFDYSVEMQKMRRKFNNKLMNYGLVGEERVAYQLKMMDDYTVCLYNVRMSVKGIKIQIDFIVITKNKIYLIEVKNLLGNIHITKENHIIRKVYYNNIYKETGMENPFIQMNTHKELLEEFLQNYRIDKPIENLLVMANDKMIIENESKYKNVIKYDEMKNYFTQNEKLSFCGNEEIIIGKLFLKYDEQYNYYMLEIIKKNIENQYTPKFNNYYDLDLYIKILKIRKKIAVREKMPLCNVFNNREAEMLVHKKPKSKEEFISIKGFKEKRFIMFGEEIIKIFKNS